MTLTLIGDVHGKFDEYYNIAKDADYSVQVGDFGFEKEWNKLYYSGLNPEKHKVLGGNHESYNTCVHSPHYLGDYGSTIIDGINIFYVRGAISINRAEQRTSDKEYFRKYGVKQQSWWSQEELNLDEMIDCIRKYDTWAWCHEMLCDKYKPKPKTLLLAHSPPASILDEIHDGDHSALRQYGFHEGFRENTSLLIDRLLKRFEPDMGCFGHHHCSYSIQSGKTTLIGLAELESMTLNSNLERVNNA